MKKTTQTARVENDLVKKKKKTDKSQIEFWIMCSIPLLFIVVFNYLPLYGIVIAFKDYKFARGIMGSDWVGLQNFKILFGSDQLWTIVANTVRMNVVNIITGEAACIALAVLLYNLVSSKATKVFQTALITPNFLSWVIASYMAFAFLNPNYGLLNRILQLFGMQAHDWYSEPNAWRFIIPIANIWKGFGMGSIMYYAALMAISPELFEALDIDGGKRWHRLRYIMLPELIPIICIKLIFAVGGIFGGDFGLFYQLPRNVGILYPVTDIMPTYTFRLLRVQGEMSISTAVGLVQSVVGLILVLVTNGIVKKIDPERSLF